MRQPASARSRAPVLRVAAVTAVVVGLLYVAVVALLLTLASHRYTRETDRRLGAQLTALAQRAGPIELPISTGDADDAPFYFWRVSQDGVVSATRAGSPELPADVANGTFPRTVRFGSSRFRLDAVTLPDHSRLVAAESLAQGQRQHDLLLGAAAWVSPVLIGGVFASALVIGWQAAKPVDRARRRQLEFTADASHELRTPLTVIEAEVGLALALDRPPQAYRDTLRRVSGETRRLRRIVEDLLWLARFDSEPPSPQTELIDLPTVVRQCAQRFEPVVSARDVELRIAGGPDDSPVGAQIAAPPEWIDRLVGVLLDNAVRYAPAGGHVDVRVTSSPTHVELAVEDDGPGIPVEERELLFDRFHRATQAGQGTGAGLGLAIGDAVVRSTHGQWSVGESASGGARMAVTWSRPHGTTAGRQRQASPSDADAASDAATSMADGQVAGPNVR